VLILLLDSDTRLNPNVITRVVPEFVAAPDLGYAQCITTAFWDQRSDYFQVRAGAKGAAAGGCARLPRGCCRTRSRALDPRLPPLQRMIWDFTFAIYHVAIGPDVSRGNNAPLVGHNAFLRWSLLEECKVRGEG